MTPVDHLGLCYASQSMKWYPNDTEELFNKNLADPKRRAELKKFGWIDADITYNINSQGFRAEEFDTRQNFVTLGCSLTQGTALPVDKTWANLVEQELKIHNWNLGVAGAGSDTCYRIARYYLPILKPDFVVMLAPEPTRLEIFYDQISRPHVFRAKNDNPETKKWLDSAWMKAWLADERNVEIYAEKNACAIGYICAQLGIDFYFFTNHSIFDALNPYPNFARDLQHPGTVVNKMFAQTVINRISSKKTFTGQIERT